MVTMHTAYILTGTNLGNRINNLQKAVQLIEQFCGKIISASSIYETAAWGLTEQPDFLNQVLCIQTKLEPPELLKNLLEIENQMGRKRIIKYGPRIIDLDILLIGNLKIETRDLIIPHPALPDRRFALIPLAEIAGSIIHTNSGKTILELLDQCNDALNVKKYSQNT
jgi:2-amino-4-hydroxy-6-hydroxymethyldihydropteridine diphosphokinase